MPSNPIHTPKKNSCRTLEGEKNVLQAQFPQEKKFMGIELLKGWKKIHTYIPNHPTPFRS